jgi:hypothetical protein
VGVHIPYDQSQQEKFEIVKYHYNPYRSLNILFYRK